MPTILDVFNQDAFSLLSMTAAVQKMPYQERRLGELGLFQPVMLETDTVVIDESDGQIQILGTRPKGAPAQKALKDKLSKSRRFGVPHIPFEETIQASELAGKRKAGETELDSIIRKVNDRLQWMRDQVENTYEIHRLGALKGVVYDADGDVILDMFDAFDVVQQTQDFAFGTATTDVRNVLVEAKRKVEAELGGLRYTGLHIFAGKNWFDEMVAHPNVVDTYRYQQGLQNRTDLRDGFDYAGVTIEEYRGMLGLTGDIGIIGDDEAYLVPLGVQGMFRANFAPGDFMETVNQTAEAMYAKVAPDLKYNKFVDVLVETNPLFMNTRPRAVIKLTKS